jgi:hypothetical protein
MLVPIERRAKPTCAQSANQTHSWNPVYHWTPWLSTCRNGMQKASQCETIVIDAALRDALQRQKGMSPAFALRNYGNPPPGSETKAFVNIARYLAEPFETPKLLGPARSGPRSGVPRGGVSMRTSVLQCPIASAAFYAAIRAILDSMGHEAESSSACSYCPRL